MEQGKRGQIWGKNEWKARILLTESIKSERKWITHTSKIAQNAKYNKCIKEKSGLKKWESLGGNFGIKFGF